MKQTLYMVRHGNTVGTDNGLMYGATELPVTEQGIKEIEAIAAQGTYPDPIGAEIYTSGMLRTEQTLNAMYGATYGELEHKQHTLLREINVGQFEMKTIEEIMADDYGKLWIAGQITDPHFENGDSMSGFRERTFRGAREIIDDCLQREKDRMIFVIHGGVITSIMYNLFPEVHSDMWDWTPTPGYGYVVELEDGQPLSWGPIGEAETGVTPRTQQKNK